MSDTQAQEAAIQEGYSERLAVSLETDWSGVLLPTRQKAAALLRSQADRIAELERELARMREPLYEALVRLLGSDPDGAIANASEDELTGAANDENADPVIREQAASVLQARAAAREYEAARGIKGDSK